MMNTTPFFDKETWRREVRVPWCLLWLGCVMFFQNTMVSQEIEARSFSSDSKTGVVVACNFYDRIGNGVEDEEDVPLSGWLFQLTGRGVGDKSSASVVQTTDRSGCTVFSDLKPGKYRLDVRAIQTGEPTAFWSPTTDPFVDIVLRKPTGRQSHRSGMVKHIKVGLSCRDKARFSPKTYWGNQQGISEIDHSDINILNLLPPFRNSSGTFRRGDEPFDGFFVDGNLIKARFSKFGELIAAQGTPLAEISQFLFDSNLKKTPRSLLAQELLVFTLNALHRLDNLYAAIELPGQRKSVASDLIRDAVQAWRSTDSDSQSAWAGILDVLNRNSKLPFIRFQPCQILDSIPQ